MEVRLVQPANALFPMCHKLKGIVMDVNDEHPLFVAHIDNQHVTCNKVEKSC